MTTLGSGTYLQVVKAAEGAFGNTDSISPGFGFAAGVTANFDQAAEVLLTNSMT